MQSGLVGITYGWVIVILLSDDYLKTSSWHVWSCISGVESTDRSGVIHSFQSKLRQYVSGQVKISLLLWSKSQTRCLRDTPNLFGMPTRHEFHFRLNIELVPSCHTGIKLSSDYFPFLTVYIVPRQLLHPDNKKPGTNNMRPTMSGATCHATFSQEQSGDKAGYVLELWPVMRSNEGNGAGHCNYWIVTRGWCLTCEYHLGAITHVL